MSSNTVPAKKPANKKAAVAPKKEEAAPAPVVAPVSRAKSTAVVPAPVVAPVVATPVVAATEGAVEELNLVAEFNSAVTRVNDLRNNLGTVLADMKRLEKRLAREIKKAGRRRRTRTPQLDEAGNPLPKKPSVFTKPQRITDDLCVFLGKPKGTEISRSDVTRGIMDYVKRHQLNAKQVINPDPALRKLLKVTEAENVTILNLQRYLKNHYIKTEATA